LSGNRKTTPCSLNPNTNGIAWCMTKESSIPAPSTPTPMATSESPNKIVDCVHCPREHLAPPPPPFYSSFAIPLMGPSIEH